MSVTGKLLSGPIATVIKIIHTCAIVVTSLRCVSSCPALAQLWETGDFSCIVILNQNTGRKLEMLIFRILATYWRKLEEFRTQSSLQVEKTIFKDNEQYQNLTSIRVYYRNIIFPPQSFPFLSQTTIASLICLQIKSSFNKLGLIIYIRAGRITIDHIGTF